MPELPTQAKSREAGVSKKRIYWKMLQVIQRMMLLHVQVQKDM